MLNRVGGEPGQEFGRDFDPVPPQRTLVLYEGPFSCCPVELACVSVYVVVSS